MSHKVDRTSKTYHNGSGVIRRPNPNLGFGPHLILDGYGCSKPSLQDLNKVYKLLDEIPNEIGMTKIMPPYVFKYSGAKPEDWGLSGFVLIAESHISIHTFPEKQYLSFDIFSCKPFNPEKAIGYLEEAFSIKKSEIRNIKRGKEFPHYSRGESIGIGKHLAEEERLEKRVLRHKTINF
ncbi:adenosylmethionine decarboxylase [Candidatus Woesearchaeota archaeon]|nr:adenosylmethionine decarboxylase [Candidatus Woesearchaeota archaeon]